LRVKRFFIDIQHAVDEHYENPCFEVYLVDSKRRGTHCYYLLETLPLLKANLKKMQRFLNYWIEVSKELGLGHPNIEKEVSEVLEAESNTAT